MKEENSPQTLSLEETTFSAVEIGEPFNDCTLCVIDGEKTPYGLMWIKISETHASKIYIYKHQKRPHLVPQDKKVYCLRQPC